MSPVGVILRIIILVVAFCLLIALFAFALKVFVFLVGVLGVLLCAAATFLVFRKLFFPKNKEPNAQESLRDTKLWSQFGEVQVFKDEPKVHQLVDKSQTQLPAKVLSVPTDVEVSVLEESDIALRIKIKTGDHKGRIGWVDKACVMGYSQKS